MSLSLPETLAAWPAGDLPATLSRELAAAGPACLGLQRQLQYGSHVTGQPQFMILGTDADDSCLSVRLGVFFQSVLSGCACADDPTPENEYNEYTELRLDIDRRDASVHVTPI